MLIGVDDVRLWHKADYLSRCTECPLSGVKQTILLAVPHVR